MTCYETIDLMDLALDGTLPRDSRPGFDEHLGECERCHTYYDQLAVTVHALRGLPRAKAVNPQRAALLEHFRRGVRRS